ncbi:Predicted O-methyltransferase YrrM [Halogranum amylolyticum]|uniref:Predicted O-methyltransferase YrrM n=1 Tax=Halogranum amylolyticum TaxID=660520 RepID=A0A1H8SLJ6_9EURY|nr:O-methyltransferase [Halogranum amylolyticum]SEO79073.1 Predicted O-methyltransferase YrrM [Halogranum amylolyticum]
MTVLPDDLARFVRATGPAHDEIQAEMADHADERGFPTVGSEVGGTLQLLARLTDARRVFEFGSGFGYSAYWFLRGMDDNGEVVLTEVDADELAMAREFFERAGVDDRASFEEGDAIDVVDGYDGPFDLVLVDNEKHRYVEAFEAVREKVPVGGVVVADNVMAGPVDFESLLAHVDGDGLGDADDATCGIADYLDTVRDDEAFETVTLPLGEGIAVSTRVQ